MKKYRKRSKKLFAGIILLLLLCSDSYALEEYIRFRRLSTTDGLSQNTVRDILQDSRGFMWFATQDGLNRYDGYTFYPYRHNPDDSCSLSNNLVICMAEDHSGALWIGAWHGGLNKLDRATDCMHHYRHHPGDSSSLSDNDITALIVSKRNPRTLWVGTDGGGLDKFDIETERVDHYRHQAGNPLSLSSDRINDLCEDADGDLWVGTQDGLNRLETHTNCIVRYDLQPQGKKKKGGTVINSIFQDRKGWLWVGTEAGLYRLNRAGDRFAVYRHLPNDPTSISNDRIKAVCEDDQGRLWIATWDGLNRLNPETEQFVRFYHEADDPNSLSYNALYSLFVDRSGILWIGSYSQGINVYDRNRNKFVLYQKDPDDANSLSDNIVKALYEDRSGMLWIGTYFGGLNQFDRRKGIFHHFVHNPDNPNSLSSNSIVSIFEDRSGLLWIATTNGGLNTYDPETGRFRCYRNVPPNPRSPSPDFINAVFEDSRKRIWIGTNHGLSELNRSAGQFITHVHNPADSFSLSNNRVKGVFEDSAGRLWVVTDGGVNQFDPESGRFICFGHQPENPNSLSHDIAVSIYESPRSPGILWISTYGGGLNRFEVETGTFRRYRERDGLPNDMAYGILEDHEGCFWLGTDRGLCRFDPVEETFTNYDVRDGLQGNEFNLALCKSKDGMMFFGGMDGLNAFYPQDIQADTFVPPVVITDLKIFNQSVALGKEIGGRVVLKSVISECDRIELSHEENVFSFDFAALNFSIPEKSRYVYKMDGVDREWIRTDATRRHATYTNLSGGHYLFKVMGSNSDGIWNDVPATIAVRIKPPYWQTVWFRMIIGFAVLLSIFLIYKFRTKNIEEKKKKLELLVQQRTDELRQQTEELQTLDKIVNLINRELVLDRVFQSLLRQGLKLQPKADRAVLLIYDHDVGIFTPAAHLGYDAAVFKDITFSREEIIDRYGSQSDEVEKNIYLIRDFKYPDNYEELKRLPMAKSIMIMIITLHGKLEGFFVLENGSDSDVFDRSDAKRLVRFRSHAISAIAKAKILQDLQNKNAEIIRTQEQLVTQQKLASLGALTAGIAHEIKNPLNFVNNFAEINIELVEELRQNLLTVKSAATAEMADEIDDILTTLKENAVRIKEHGKRADSIVRSMLQHSRGKSGEKQPTDINAMMEEDLNLAYHGMRAQDSDFNIKIEKDLDRFIAKLDVVPQDISRVFLNILSNGFYETQKKKMTRGKNFVPTVWIKTLNLKNAVEIRIRDNGNGIPAAIRDKLFAPFFTTKPAGQGTGLGLSISYDIIVHGHGGKIIVETEEGEYSEFIIRLPVTGD
ncbi:hypothetical protein JXO59_04885 [candidate division KSB1 bacterium]|nr:hypothetical protein [candidate division KSB1 bacterium]